MVLRFGDSGLAGLLRCDLREGSKFVKRLVSQDVA